MRKRLIQEWQVSRGGNSLELDKLAADSLGWTGDKAPSREEFLTLGPEIKLDKETKKLGTWLNDKLEDRQRTFLCRARSEVDSSYTIYIANGKAQVRCRELLKKNKSGVHQLNNYLNNLSLNAELLRIQAAKYADEALDKTAKQVVTACRELSDSQNQEEGARRAEDNCQVDQLLRGILDGAGEEKAELRIWYTDKLPIITYLHIGSFVNRIARNVGWRFGISLRNERHDDADFCMEFDWPESGQLLNDEISTQWRGRSSALCLANLTDNVSKFDADFADNLFSLRLMVEPFGR